MNKIRFKIGLYCLLTLLLLSIFDLVIFNSKPLIIYYEGKLFFPFIVDYLNTDFNLSGSILVNYKESELQLILQKSFVIFPPFFYDFKEIYPAFLSPSWTHFLGTGENGEDIFLSLLSALKYIFFSSFLILLISTLIGLVFGILQGYFEGKVDILLQRIYEIFLAIPLIYILLLWGNLVNNIFFYIIIIACFQWVFLIPYVRLYTLDIKHKTFIKSLKNMNLKSYKIIFKHILPLVLIRIKFLLLISLMGIISFLVGLHFLGVEIDYLYIGDLMRSGMNNLEYPWIIGSVIGFFAIITLLFICMLDHERLYFQNR